MRKKELFLYSLVSIFFCLILIAVTPNPMHKNKRHCYALISPINANDDKASTIITSECFNNFSDSIFAATKGRVKLNRSIQPGELTDEMLNGREEQSSFSYQVVIGIDWDDNDYRGGSYTWVVDGNGCSSTIQYGVSSMPSGWDNRVSSARGYSNCNSFYHYKNTNYDGSLIVCDPECSSMGTLNNATSSEKWRYTP